MSKRHALSGWSTNFLRALQVDLQRAVLSTRFLLTVVLMLAWLLVNGATNIYIYNFLYAFGIAYTFDQAMTGGVGLGMIILSIATVPFSTSYLTDRESGFGYHIIKRVGFGAYSFARVIAVGLSAFLAMVTAAGIFLVGLCLSGAPHAYPVDVYHLNGVYYELTVTGQTWLYYLIRFIISGLTAAVAAVFALFSSSLIPNTYVALLSPLVGYYAFENILLHIIYSMSNGQTIWLNAFSLAVITAGQVSRNHFFSFLWASAYLLTLFALLSWGFICRLRREQGL